MPQLKPALQSDLVSLHARAAEAAPDVVQKLVITYYYA